MEKKKDDGPEKVRFVVLRDEVYQRYTVQDSRRRSKTRLPGPGEGQRPGCQFGSEKKYLKLSR